MNSVDTAPPTFCVGESGVRSSGNSLLELLEPPQPPVEVGVGERRVCRARSSASARPRSPRPAAGAPRAPRPAPGSARPRERSWGLSCRVPPTSRPTRRRPPIRPGSAPNPVRDRHRDDPVTSPPAPALTRLDAPDTRAVVLMLHGGKEHSTERVDGRSASWRRSLLMQRSITPRRARGRSATWLLRYRHRGWNGGTGPVADARWALAEVRRELGEVPVVLLGHSMGGAPPSTSPTTPRSAAWSGSPRGSPPASRWRALAGRPARRRTVDATGSRRTTRPRRSSSAPPRSPGRRAGRHGPGRPLHAPQRRRMERGRPRRRPGPARLKKTGRNRFGGNGPDPYAVPT